MAFGKPLIGTNGDVSKDVEIVSPPSDGISSVHWSPQSDHLAAASWDGSVRVWEVNYMAQSRPAASFQQDAPVLTVRWASDGTKIFSGGADKQIRAHDCQSSQTIVIGAHEQPVSSIRIYEEQRLVVSASWDRSLCCWDMRQQQPCFKTQLSERIYSMDLQKNLLAVATADKKTQYVDITQFGRNPSTLFVTEVHPLKHQLRVVSCFPDSEGFAAGSIEGRVAIQLLRKGTGEESFSFRCHRDTANPPNVYPVNDIVFHPVHGTIVTCGGDGSFHIWDRGSRTRLKSFNTAGNGIAIPCGGFNRSGSMFAYALSYDWARGHTHYNLGAPNTIKIHPVNEVEVKAKKSK